MFIYILKLKNEKYYIGKSRNKNTLIKRIKQHYTYRGSVWTKKYKPQKIIDVIKYDENDKYIEDKIVFDYMNKYGIDNVRGGSFCQIKLNQEEIKIIKKIIQTEEDRCFYCNSNEHLINKCEKYKNRNKKKIKIEKIEEIDELYLPEIKKENCCNKFKKYLLNLVFKN